MSPIKILFISHGHPHIQMGGAEVHAYNLFKGFQESPDFDPIFLARTFSSGYANPKSTPFRCFESRPNEILWYTSGHFDWLNKTMIDKEVYTYHFARLLDAYQPDVVHIQHLDGIGLGLIRQIKKTLPDTAIVYTLHELQAICNAGGLMLRSDGKELCYEDTPARCHECFPSISPASFLLRRRMIWEQLRYVDVFLAPSEFLRQRYVEWGVPEEKIRFEEYGRFPPQPSILVAEPPLREIGFFGQIAPHKGLLTLLDAAKILRQAGFEDFHISINGTNLEQQRGDFQEAFRRGLEECGDSVSFLGAYRNEDVGDRMRGSSWILVPSVWWENSPLVIQEAFMYRRPVLCSDIGGMAEKVRDGVDGYHFRVGDPSSLAQTIRQAVSSRDTWRSLQQQIRPIYTMAETLEVHAALYRSLRQAVPA
ncbi:MAG: glycosyltransferase family 4 protein [Thermoanaerobaculia bacterium]|nr:glycosyltransferase family 4 protein [Thermoanaerobaculia bacterium]